MAAPPGCGSRLPCRLGESDFILNGNTAWLWQSNTNSVTRLGAPG